MKENYEDKRVEEENDEDDEDDEDNNDENNYEESKNLLDVVIENLCDNKVNQGQLSVHQVQYIIGYVKQKLKEGLPQSYILSMLSRPKFILLIHNLNESTSSFSSTQSSMHQVKT